MTLALAYFAGFLTPVVLAGALLAWLIRTAPLLSEHSEDAPRDHCDRAPGAADLPFHASGVAEQ